MKWSGTKVLVTGAGGFIGSHLTERLLASGARVSALVHYRSNLSLGWLSDLPKDPASSLEVFRGDIRDDQFVRQAVRGQQVVFHLAALISIPYSYVSPLAFVRTNVEGTANLLAAAVEAGVEKFVHTSTSEVYGTAQKVPIDEQHPLHAQSPYAASKIAADQLASSFHLSFNLPVATIRPFNVYGPRQSERAIIPTIAVQALLHDEVSVGSAFPLRDFTYVDDTVSGFLRIAEEPRAVGRVINIGSGREISIRDTAELIGKILAKQVRIRTEEGRIRPAGSEVERLLADTRLAQQLLGWAPGVSLEEGLGRTIEWFRERLSQHDGQQYWT